MLLGEGYDQLLLARLDLETLRWFPYHEFHFSFTDPETENTYQLNELQASIKNGRIAVTGTDAKGDVYVTEHLVDSIISGVAGSLAGQPWSETVTIPLGNSIDGMPTMAMDRDGNTHIAWSQAPAPNPNGDTIYYTRWISASNTLSYPVELFEANEEGAAHQPDLAASTDGWLHLVWSGSSNDPIQYSRASLAEAGSQGGWSVPEPITLPGIYSSPHIVAPDNGHVYIIFTIPVNESRGVYMIVSANSGKDWSDPILIFDAQANQYLRVDYPTLTLSPDGSIYAAWVKTEGLDRLSPGEIAISSSRDGGTSWSEPTVIAGQGYSWPKLVYNSGAVHILYTSTSGSVNHRYLLSKVASGNGVWSRAAEVTGFQDLGFDEFAAPFSIAEDGGISNGTLHLTGASSQKGILYSQWNGEQWQAVEYHEMASPTQLSGGAYVGAAPQGSNLSVAWISVVQEEEQSIAGDATLGISYNLNLTTRKIPAQEVAPVTIPTTIVVDRPVEPLVPTDTPAPEPTPTPNIATPLQTESSIPPMLLGGSLAAFALAMIFLLRILLHRMNFRILPFRK
jgi:hypothetical protein